MKIEDKSDGLVKQIVEAARVYQESWGRLQDNGVDISLQSMQFDVGGVKFSVKVDKMHVPRLAD